MQDGQDRAERSSMPDIFLPARNEQSAFDTVLQIVRRGTSLAIWMVGQVEPYFRNDRPWPSIILLKRTPP